MMSMTRTEILAWIGAGTTCLILGFVYSTNILPLLVGIYLITWFTEIRERERFIRKQAEIYIKLASSRMVNNLLDDYSQN